MGLIFVRKWCDKQDLHGKMNLNLSKHFEGFFFTKQIINMSPKIPKDAELTLGGICFLLLLILSPAVDTPNVYCAQFIIGHPYYLQGKVHQWTLATLKF